MRCLRLSVSSCRHLLPYVLVVFVWFVVDRCLYVMQSMVVCPAKDASWVPCCHTPTAQSALQTVLFPHKPTQNRNRKRKRSRATAKRKRKRERQTMTICMRFACLTTEALARAEIVWACIRPPIWPKVCICVFTSVCVLLCVCLSGWCVRVSAIERVFCRFACAFAPSRLGFALSATNIPTNIITSSTATTTTTNANSPAFAAHHRLVNGGHGVVGAGPATC